MGTHKASLALLALAAAAKLTFAGRDVPEDLGRVKVDETVEVRDWDFDDPEFAKKVVNIGTPCIFRMHPASDWKAFEGSQGFKAMQDGKRKLRGQGLGIGGKWQNKGFLVDALGADTDMHVTSSKSENFAYSRVTELRPSYPGWKAPTSEHWTKVGKFAKNIERDTQHFVKNTTTAAPRKYFSKIIDSDSMFMKVLWDIYPFQPLVPFGTESDTTVHVWWGGAGTRSTPHYDQSHNMFLQIVGEKKFWLASPKYFTQFQVYPLHNPSGRHSQLANGWPWWNTTKYPYATAEDDALLRKHLPSNHELGELRMQEAHLRPGDLLYIPSLWFHTTEAVGTTQSFGLSFWSTNMQMLEITIEKEQSKECAAQLFEIPISRKPKMDRLKAMLFASILRVLDDAYDIDEPREIPHVPGPIARAVFLRHAGRFHKGVCNTKEYMREKKHRKSPVEAWMKLPAKASQIPDEAQGVAGSRIYARIPCLRDAVEIQNKWHDNLAANAGRDGFEPYGGKTRIAAVVIEALAGGVIGHAAACSWFAELGAYLRAQALTDDFPNPPAPSPPRAKKEKKREPPVLPEPVFENERSLAEVYKEELTRLYAEFNPSKVDQIDGLLKKYEGKEQALIDGVKEKYKEIAAKKAAEEAAAKAATEEAERLETEEMLEDI